MSRRLPVYYYVKEEQFIFFRCYAMDSALFHLFLIPLLDHLLAFQRINMFNVFTSLNTKCYEKMQSLFRLLIVVF